MSNNEKQLKMVKVTRIKDSKSKKEKLLNSSEIEDASKKKKIPYAMGLKLNINDTCELVNIKGLQILLESLEKKIKSNLYQDAIYNSFMIAKDRYRATEAMINKIGSYITEIANKLMDADIIDEDDIISLVFTLQYKPVSLNIFDFNENEKLNEKIVAKLARLA